MGSPFDHPERSIVLKIEAKPGVVNDRVKNGKKFKVSIGESFVTSLFTFCFISIHFQVEKETR